MRGLITILVATEVNWLKEFCDFKKWNKALKIFETPSIFMGFPVSPITKAQIAFFFNSIDKLTIIRLLHLKLDM